MRNLLIIGLAVYIAVMPSCSFDTRAIKEFINNSADYVADFIKHDAPFAEKLKAVANEVLLETYNYLNPIDEEIKEPNAIVYPAPDMREIIRGLPVGEENLLNENYVDDAMRLVQSSGSSGSSGRLIEQYDSLDVSFIAAVPELEEVVKVIEQVKTGFFDSVTNSINANISSISASVTSYAVSAGKSAFSSIGSNLLRGF